MLMLAAAAAALKAQSTVPGGGADGRRVGICFRMRDAGIGDLDLRAGMVLEGFLELGLGCTVDFTPVDALPSREFTVSVLAGASVLRQDERMPISFLLTGSYGKASFISDSLAAQGLTRSGTGFTVGAELSRDFRLSDAVHLGLSLTGLYESTVYTTEPAGGSAGAIVVANPVNYWYGLRTGLVFVLADGFALSLDVPVALDKDLRIWYGPTLGFLSWDVKQKN
jgi:hypothetical protein